MGKPAARIGDMHMCPMVTPGLPPIPHVGGPIIGPGCPTVLIGGMPAAVMGDICTCVGPPDTIVLGSAGVMIGGKPAARMGDQCAHGGAITLGCPTVLIGEVAGGGGAPLILMPTPALESVLVTLPDQKQKELKKGMDLKKGAEKNAPFVKKPVSPHQTSPPPQPPKKIVTNDEKNKACNFSSLHISEGGRNKVLDIKSMLDEKRTLQVVAGSSGGYKKVKVEAKEVKGQCDTHKKEVISAPSINSSELINKSATEIEFKALSYPIDLDQSPYRYWPLNAQVNSKNITGELCGKKINGFIEIYPDLKYTLKANINLAKNAVTKESGDVSIKLTRVYSGNTVEIGGNLTKFVNDIEKLITLIDEGTKLFSIIVADESAIKPKWPKIELQGEWGWKEEPTDSIAGFDCTFSFGLNPLIGIEIKVDLLGAALLAIPGIGVALKKFKSLVERTKLGEVKVEFTVTGIISATGSIKKEVAKKKWQFDKIKFTGSIEASLEGSIKSKVSAWGITVSEGGVKLGGKSKIELSGEPGMDNTGLFIKLTADWNGLIITSQFYLNIGFAETTEGLPDDATGGKAEHEYPPIIEPKPAFWQKTIYLIPK